MEKMLLGVAAGVFTLTVFHRKAQKIEKYKSKLQTLSEELTNLGAEKVQVSDDLASMRTEVLKRQQVCETIRAIGSELESVIYRLENDKLALKEEKIHYTEKCFSLERTLRDGVQTREDCQHLASVVEREKNKLLNQMTEMQSIEKKLRSEAEVSALVIRNCEAQITKVNDENQRLTRELISIRFEIGLQTRANSALQTDITIQKEQISAHFTEKVRMLEEIAILKGEISRANEVNRQLCEDNAELNKFVDLKASNDLLLEQVSNLRHANECYSIDNRKLQAKFDASRYSKCPKSDSERRILKLLEDNINAKRENDKIRKELSEIYTKMQQAVNEKKTLDSQQAVFVTERGKASAEIAKLTTQLKDSIEANKDLTEKLRLESMKNYPHEVEDLKKQFSLLRDSYEKEIEELKLARNQQAKCLLTAQDECMTYRRIKQNSEKLQLANDDFERQIRELQRRNDSQSAMIAKQISDIEARNSLIIAATNKEIDTQRCLVANNARMEFLLRENAELKRFGREGSVEEQNWPDSSLLEIQFADLLQKSEDLKQQLEAQTEQCIQARSDKDRMTSDRSLLEIQFADLLQKNEGLKQQLKVQTEKCKKAKSDNDQIILQISAQNTEIAQLKGKIALKQTEVNSLQEEVNSANQSAACCVCLSDPKTILFWPCWHVNTCEGCCQRIQNCPICRQRVEKKYKIYF